MHKPLQRMATVQPSVRLRPLRASDESAFMQGLRWSRELLKPWVQVPMSRKAVELAIGIAFKRLKLHRLEANIQPDNLASIALVRACGFSKEGFSPRFLKNNGQWRDHERWAMLAD